MESEEKRRTMSLRQVLLLTILILALIVLAGCASPTATPVPTPLPIATMQPGAHAGHAESSPIIANARMVMMDAREFAFSPKQIHVKPGEPVTIMFLNEGQLAHDVKIDGVSFHAHAEPNKSVEASFIAPHQGEYEFYCSAGGHKDAGMVGQLIVE